MAEKTLEQKTLTWLGHLVRLGEKRWVKNVWKPRLIGRNKRGRPR